MKTEQLETSIPN